MRAFFAARKGRLEGRPVQFPAQFSDSVLLGGRTAVWDDLLSPPWEALWRSVPSGPVAVRNGPAVPAVALTSLIAGAESSCPQLNRRRSLAGSRRCSSWGSSPTIDQPVTQVYGF
jgi:hypothetical protein